MQNFFNLSLLRQKTNNLIDFIGTFIASSWPINWNGLKKPKIVLTVIVNSSYYLKIFLLGTMIGLLISIYFFSVGVYLASTIEIPANGGEMQESVTGTMKVFNPVLDLGQSEKKVADLLYHPLYYIDYPDFLTSAENDPKISPVLIEKPPTWQDSSEAQADNRYKILRFKLKSNLMWSDKKPITLDDVEYTFERLKENKSNPLFKDVFSKVEFSRVPNSSMEFDLRSAVANPQLIYASNFSPIPKSYFNNQNVESLYTDFRSVKSLVTSGYYTFFDKQVKDPVKNDNQLRNNPIKDDSGGGYSTVVLARNQVQNSTQSPYFDKYIFKRYNQIFDLPGTSSTSIERYAKLGKVDLYTRNLNPSLGQTSTEIKNKLELNQKVIPTNTYYNLYLNIQRNGYFINQSLRKYLICHFINFKANPAYYDFIEEIPKNKRLLPIQFSDSKEADCPANPDDALDQKFYKLAKNEKTGVANIYLRANNSEVMPSLLGFAESEPLLSDVRNFMLKIGFPTTLIDSTQVNEKLSTQDYNLAFLPTLLVSRDLYPIYGATGRNLLQIRSNNRVTDYKVEDNLKQYSSSNLTDSESKIKLIDFFSKEFVSVNLFRSKYEINSSVKISDLNNNLPGVTTLEENLYRNQPQWHTQTRRKFR